MHKSMSRGRLVMGAALLAAVSYGMLNSPTPPLAAAPPKSDSKVKINATGGPVASDGRQLVKVTLAIDPGWHLYANPLDNKEMEGLDIETTLTVKNAPAQVYYPAGKWYNDKNLTDPIRVYEGTVTIQAVVKRTPGQPVEMNVSLNACDDNSCLLPATVKVTIP